MERLWGRLKEWRAVATRYEKLAQSFLGVLCLAATMDWLKPQQSLDAFSKRSRKVCEFLSYIDQHTPNLLGKAVPTMYL